MPLNWSLIYSPNAILYVTLNHYINTLKAGERQLKRQFLVIFTSMRYLFPAYRFLDMIILTFSNAPEFNTHFKCGS